MHAVILAGGKGVRLRPYTTALPKPLVPIGDEYAILEIVLRQLAQQGFTAATLAIGHLGQHHPRLRRRRARSGASGVDYSTEDEPARHDGPAAAPCGTGCPRRSSS